MKRPPSPTYSRRDALRLGATGAGALALTAACGGAGGSGSGSGKEIVISQGSGLSYAALVIIQANGWLEKDLPGRTISWRTVSGGNATRDGLVSGSLHLGSSGLGPFLIGWGAGIPWKIISSLNDMPLWLVAKDPRLRGLKDFRPTDKIAAIAPGSIQSVMLQRAAQQQLGDAHALDRNIASMAHPDALQALIGGQIAAAYTAPPFQFQAVEQGARKLVDSYDLFGKHGFNTMVATQDYAEKNPDVIAAVHRNIAKANDLIVNSPAEAARILSQAEKGKISPATYQKYLTHPGIEYTTTPHSLLKLGAFMKEVGVVKKVPGDWREVVFDTVKNENGS
ncbi:ABC transporter substrate-binding protein [Actinomadura sp. NBRC 104412]|uniref:ABC transporter substrate-binding protein n=1 Tax=Actinomadura sp. NBRC 104412 TaxID=3032203 RepID=UPI0024A1433A|nr:ABC transporter substrate-binding protein [Actinomadura sp. NBRC 104412]GLZ09429.1 ABC transporter substrate-binding protein [Actinomadura sp. NBRC 104412]